jgi:hypothetical protein
MANFSINLGFIVKVWKWCLDQIIYSIRDFFFFFLHVHTRGWKIRTSDLRFMMRGPQSIELLFENN